MQYLSPNKGRKMSLPYFPMFPSDFEAKTSHLTLEEDGAYNRLLRIMWMTPGCSLPDDNAWIQRRMRVDSDIFERVVLVVIEEFCERKNGRVSNAKLTEVFEESSAKHKKRVEAGSKGGRAKSLKSRETDPSKAKAKLKQPEPEPEPELYLDTSLEVSVISQAIEDYNLFALEVGWPRCQKTNSTRSSKLKKRLKDCGGIDGWNAALTKASESDFLCNRTSANFTASIDFLLQESSFTKLMEGNYDNRTNSQARLASADTTAFAISAAAKARRKPDENCF